MTVFESEGLLGQKTTNSCEGGLLFNTQGFFYPQLETILQESREGWTAFLRKYPSLIYSQSFLRVAYHQCDWENVEEMVQYVTKTAQVEMLNPTQIAQEEAYIARNAIGAMKVVGEKAIDTRYLMFLLTAELLGQNIKLFSEIRSISFDRARGCVELQNYDRHTRLSEKRMFDYAVVAAGPNVSEKLLGLPPVDEEKLSHGVLVL